MGHTKGRINVIASTYCNFPIGIENDWECTCIMYIFTTLWLICELILFLSNGVVWINIKQHLLQRIIDDMWQRLNTVVGIQHHLKIKIYLQLGSDFKVKYEYSIYGKIIKIKILQNPHSYIWSATRILHWIWKKNDATVHSDEVIKKRGEESTEIIWRETVTVNLEYQLLHCLETVYFECVSGEIQIVFHTHKKNAFTSFILNV